MAEKLYSIGQVVAMLKAEFPDITVSKIRFLESSGLIKPKRRNSGYRLFSEKDFSRLRSILVYQRDHYLPLNVIKEKIDMEDDIEFKTISSSAISKEITKEMTAQELVSDFDVSPEFLDEMEKYLIIKPHLTPEGKSYSEEDVAIIISAKKLSAFGIFPRHLRVHENFASKEALILEQILFPMVRQKGTNSKEVAKKAYENILKLLLTIHSNLLKKSIKKRFPELEI